MKDEPDYIRDIAEIRSMMERSTKFVSLSGWAGILAGFYALAGAYIAFNILGFNPDRILYNTIGDSGFSTNIILLAVITFALAICTAILLSYRDAARSGLKLWNPTSKRLLAYMGVPFMVGAILIIILISKALIGLVAPFSLLFYGLALYNAGKFTYAEVRVLGIVEILLGLFGACYVECGLLMWAIGFGFAHIVYGIYMHYKYKK